MSDSASLDEIQAKVANAIETGTDLKLRRTQTNEGKESTADAIVRDEPYQGKVKFLVQLQGISDKVSKALSAKFGNVEVRRVDFVDRGWDGPGWSLRRASASGEADTAAADTRLAGSQAPMSISARPVSGSHVLRR